MEKSKILGWDSVYKFTFIQMLKSKSFKISTIILCLLSLVVFPIISMVDSENKENIKKTSIKKVYVFDETTLNQIDYNDITKDMKKYKNTEFVREEQSFDDMKNELIKQNNDGAIDSNNSILLNIKYNENTFEFDYSYSENSSIKKSDVESISEDIEQFFQNEKVNNVGLEKEQSDILNVEITTEIKFTNDSGDFSENSGSFITDSEKSVVFYIVTILFMFIAFFGGSVAGLIIIEKSNKVIEYLMTSIKPLAIIVGKILAAFTSMIVQVFSIIISLIISIIISVTVFDYEAVDELNKFIKSKFGDEIFSNLSFANIIVSIIIFILGFLIFSSIAGLAGATVSRIEDSAEGTKILTFSMLIGFYIDYGLIVGNKFGSGGIEYIGYFLPISSPFVVPTFLLMGKIPLWIGIVALIILLISLYLLFKIIADVYESIIYYKGTIKIKDIINLSKVKRKERRNSI
ncbi:MAG: ABC transporter permease [Clostridiales bacterium]